MEDQGELNPKEEKDFNSSRERAEKDILEAADVVCCTCINSGDHRLKNFKFRHVLIDEAP